MGDIQIICFGLSIKYPNSTEQEEFKLENKSSHI